MGESEDVEARLVRDKTLGLAGDLLDGPKARLDRFQVAGRLLLVGGELAESFLGAQGGFFLLGDRLVDAAEGEDEGGRIFRAREDGGFHRGLLKDVPFLQKVAEGRGLPLLREALELREGKEGGSLGEGSFDAEEREIGLDELREASPLLFGEGRKEPFDSGVRLNQSDGPIAQRHPVDGSKIKGQGASHAVRGRSASLEVAQKEIEGIVRDKPIDGVHVAGAFAAGRIRLMP